jgi:hypothetical protein
MCPSTAYQGAETLCIYMYECKMQSTRGLEGQPSFRHDKIFFSKPALMNIHTTHRIYKIAVRKK